MELNGVRKAIKMRNRGDNCNCGAVQELIDDGEIWTKEDIKTELEALIQGAREELQDICLAWEDEPEYIKGEQHDCEIYLLALFDVAEKFNIKLGDT